MPSERAQPIAALQLAPLEWVLLGGTFKVRNQLESAGATFDPNLWANVYRGKELPDRLRYYCQYVKPLGEVAPAPVPEPVLPPSIEAEHWRVRWRRSHSRNHPMLYAEPKPTPIGFVPPSWFDELIFYLQHPDVYPAIAIVGPTGNGKSTVSYEAFNSLDRSFYVIDITEFIEPFELVGGMSYHPEQGNVWIHGAITRAFREGCDVVINEYDAANPRAVMCLQSVFQDPGINGQTRYVTTPGAPEHDRIFPQGPCQIIVTMNTYGSGANRHYVGRNALDAAQLDRFAYIQTGYENEALILESKGYPRKVAKTLEAWAIKMREKIDQNALRLNVSPRTLARMANLMTVKNFSLADAANRAFFSRVEVEDQGLLR